VCVRVGRKRRVYCGSPVRRVHRRRRR
jgi:hypothetical protein